jgi:hypothetical protein
MSAFFAMVEGAPAFFLLRRQAPAGAVEIEDARHRELLDAQAEGKEIYTGEDGSPRYRQQHIPAADRREAMARIIRAEARRRILLVSPEWRQMNDLREPSEEGAARFIAIDAIRAASNKIEIQLADTPASELDDFQIRANPLWESA